MVRELVIDNVDWNVDTLSNYLFIKSKAMQNNIRYFGFWTKYLSSFISKIASLSL